MGGLPGDGDRYRMCADGGGEVLGLDAGCCCARGDLTAFVLPARPLDQDLVDQSLEQVNNAVKRRTAVVGIFPATRPWSGWPGRSWSRPMTRCFYVLSSRRGRWLGQLSLHETEQLAGQGPL